MTCKDCERLRKAIKEAIDSYDKPIEGDVYLPSWNKSQRAISILEKALEGENHG